MKEEDSRTINVRSPSEVVMWRATSLFADAPDDEDAIAERYVRGDGRIVIETNREKLPGFVRALSDQDYMDLRPFYQRRPRWDVPKQSLLIESFIMNIPVPPVFLYERSFNSYEVMDGQQRITALRDFYENRFALKGLRVWPSLNGRKYHSLPQAIRSGLDRRSISSIVVLKESTGDDDEADFLRETVFERLNTGGVQLSAQEIRNALHQSKFNDLLWELSALDQFRDIWSIPRFVPNEIDANPWLSKNSMYAKMEDLELVLRFFALRHAEYYTRGMRGFLDLYMSRAARFMEDDVRLLRLLFLDVLDLAIAIYGEKVFCPVRPDGSWEQKPQKAFYDAVMVGLSRYVHRRDEILKSAKAITSSTVELFLTNDPGTFTGRGNTKEDVQGRISLYSNMIGECLG